MVAPVLKAVIPAAGRGTRLLPLTRVLPKEMLPLGARPMIDHCILEALASGIRELCVVVNPTNQITRRHVEALVEEQRHLFSGCLLTTVDQPEPLGLADAIYRAKDFVRGQPFAVLLPDNILIGERPAMGQLMAAFQEHHRDMVGMIRVTRTKAWTFSHCGLISCRRTRRGIRRLTGLSPKLPGPLDLGNRRQALKGFPRYIYHPHVFEYIDGTRGMSDGELDDVPVLQAMIGDGALFGTLLNGTGFDAGNLDGYWAANFYLSRRAGEGSVSSGYR